MASRGGESNRNHRFSGSNHSEPDGRTADNGRRGYDFLVSSNSGVPSRKPRDPSSRSGDALAGPADSARPANPWPRLLAFGAFVLASLFIAGLCFASFANTPDREIRVRHNEYEEGLPRFLPVTSFGYDERNRTFGAYIGVPEDTSPTVALFSKDPASGCNVIWEPLTANGERRGIYVDPCSDARYDFNGVALHDGATSDLHRFEVRREETGYVVSFEELILGACRNGATEDCSPAGEELRIPVPKGTLPSSFGE